MCMQFIRLLLSLLVVERAQPQTNSMEGLKESCEEKLRKVVKRLVLLSNLKAFTLIFFFVFIGWEFWWVIPLILITYLLISFAVFSNIAKDIRELDARR